MTTAPANADPAVFSAASLALVQRLIPPERLHFYLVDLDRQLQLVLNASASDQALESLAHKIVSQAGMLGLTRMSECARALEDACRSGLAPAPALRRCRAAVRDIELYAMPAAARPAGQSSPSDI